MFRALQKLTRNGSSTCVTIPRQILIPLGWLPGQAVVVEVLEDRSVHIRLPVLEDVSPARPSKFYLEPQSAGKL